MKRPLLFAILAVIAALAFAYLATTVPALAAPAAQETRPVIAQPAQDTPVRDVVQIIGTATHPQFQRYELYYAPSPVPSDQSWTFIGDAHNNQQPLGLLGTWDSRSVPDGAYVLRVRVVRQDGNYIDSDARRVIVANTRPPETPTPNPADTPLPELPPTEAPATDQPVVEQPTVVVAIPTIAPTPTLEPNDAAAIASGPNTPEVTPTRQVISASGSTTSSGSDSGSVSEIAGQVFSGSRLLGTARKAATYTVAIFLAIGAFFAIKGILVWLWYKIKP
jgi:hypothetical protein